MTIPIDRLNIALEDRYHVLHELGEGGMAKVYLAHDLKHERQVAVKVLRPELAAVVGSERFLTEIKTTAQLQHPHILPLFDSGEADGFLYYVMPYVEGESLRTKLDRERQLDVDEAVHITQAVASALQYAHDREVIHRDIKPENILLHAGEPVVADFGIALAVSAAGGGRLTETGLSLGTPHYMSPEQASADHDLTARSDLYSLACVLYEMLTGQPPHTGPSAQSILVRILTEEPRPVTDVRPAVPGHVWAVVSKGLEKLPADRFKSADELRAALSDPTFTHARGRPGAVAAEERPLRSRRPWSAVHAAVTGVLALATVGLALALASRGASPGPEEAPVFRFLVLDSVPPAATDYLEVEVADDGTLAFAPPGALFVRPPGALEATRIVDADWAEFSFSPDGTEIVFTPDFPPTELRTVPVSGGPVVDVWTGDGALAGSPLWGDDGWIYFASGEGRRDELRRVPAVGGDDELLLESPGGTLAPSTLLPGGGALLYTSRAPGSSPRVMLVELDSRDTTELVAEGLQASWTPTGHLVYAHPDGALWAAPFDLDRGQVTGPSAPVEDGVHVGDWWANYSLSSSGTLAFMSGTGEGWTFSLVDEEGRREPLPIEPSDHWDISISPDGGFAAYTRDDDIWTFDLDRGSNVALTEGSTGLHDPTWSPDGTRIAYLSTDGVRVRPVDRSTDPETLEGTGADQAPQQWLEDGTILLDTDGDIAATGIDGGTPPRMLLEADWSEQSPSVSPDGRWLAYLIDRGGSRQLYVRSWPGLLGETRVSAGDVEVDLSYPQWSPNSNTLYYLEGRQLMAADVRTDPAFVVEGRRALPVQVNGYLRGAHPDGRLVLAESDGSEAEGGVGRRLIVVTNWFEVLKERLGGG